MSNVSHFYDDASSAGRPCKPRPQLSVLDGKIKHQLYRACEAFGSEAAFARAYGVNINSVNRSMNGWHAVRGSVLMAVLAWTLGHTEPVVSDRAIRTPVRPYRTYGKRRRSA